jgi:hypothetical protein
MLAAVGEPDGSEGRTCFVAMPVTTPASYAEDLRDSEHFGHVLAHLFTPALERAGYEVIPPKTLGAALIHAEIIKHLEQADLVLADLSSHNANVFFELGIRTSLDRPVVLVKDKRTTAIPFDLGTINVLTYDEALTPWTLEEEIRHLAEHVGSVPVDGDSGNAMWQYFGLTKRGDPAEAGSLEEKVNLVLAEVTKLRLAPPTRSPAEPTAKQLELFVQLVSANLGRGLGPGNWEYYPSDGPGDVAVHVWGPITERQDEKIRDMGERVGVMVSDVMVHPPLVPPVGKIRPRPGPAGPEA